MRFTDVFIKRPVFASTLSLMLLIIGIMSYSRLQVRQLPKLGASVVTIAVAYPGVNAKVMESFVTEPIENAISDVDGVDCVNSSSVQGRSAIVVHMRLGYDINTALANISNKVRAIRYILPKDIYDPVISKKDPGKQATMYIAFTNTKQTPEQLTDYLIRNVQPQLQTLSGIAQAQILGSSQYAMRVWLDPTKMAATNVTALDVQRAIRANNVQAAIGRVKGEMQEYNINAQTDIRTAKQFNNIVIRNNANKPVRIQNIGYAKLGAEERRTSVVMNGKSSIIMSIIIKSNANPLVVSKEVNNVLPKLSESFPAGVSAHVLYDASKFIDSSINEVSRTIIEACFIVFFVIFVTIGSFRSVIVPLVTIPLSLIGVCGIMFALGYSINVLTLLACMLAIGLVVDDAIVVLENIHRHLDEGIAPKEAALLGAQEIAFAVIAMTGTLAAVYAPIGFMSGLTGKLFTEFSFTLAGSVIVSGFIALTLSPMLCSKLLRNKKEKGRFEKLVSIVFDKLQIGYQWLLRIALKLRYIVIIIALIIYGSCYFLYIHTPKELAPKEDKGVLFAIVKSPASASLKYTEKHSKFLSSIYKTVPELYSYGIINGAPDEVSSAISFLVLKPWDKRARTAAQIKRQLFPLAWAIPGVKVFLSEPPSIPGSGWFFPVSIVLKTTSSYADLNNMVKGYIRNLKKWGGLLYLDSSLKIDRPQMDVKIDRDKAANLGISMGQIAASLNLFLGLPTVTKFTIAGRNYDVVPALLPRFRKTPSALNNLQLRTKSRRLVSLGNLIKTKTTVVPRSLEHFQQLRSANITASLAPGVTLGDALTHMAKVARRTLPSSVQLDYAGQSRQYMQAMGKMAEIFICALIFIYLMLAAQFESFRDPLIVMLSVPLSISGALLTLLLAGGTINIFTQIGLITLVGLITKNGILIVEFANQLREQGKELKEAVMEAAVLRLRPILMTSLTMILGGMPLIFAAGAGSVSRHQLGLVVVGGMSFGTLLTLFVIPIAYYMFTSKKKFQKN